MLAKLGFLSCATLVVVFGCSSETGSSVASAGAPPGAAGAPVNVGAGGAGSSAAGAAGSRAGSAGQGGGGLVNVAGSPNGGTSSGGASSAGAAPIAGSSNAGASAVAGSMNGGGSNGGSSNGGAGPNVNAASMVAAMGFGTNIGNSLDNTTTWETGWGEPLISQSYINGIASRGIKTVRVPVAWNTYAVNGVIDASKMSRVKEVVGWITAAGMYAVVNIHWDGGWIDNETNANKNKLTDDVKTKFASYWKQIATAFSTVGPQLIFEGMNEEGKYYVDGNTSGTPDYAALNTMNQLFVTTVRAQSGFNAGRALLIAGFATDIALTCVDAFKIPSDPAGEGKLFLSLHYYTPYTFCGLDSVETWGSPRTTWGTAADKTELQTLFDKLATFSTSHKVPIIIGEFGVTLGEKYPRDQASRALWMESVAKAAIARKMVPVLWDTGSDIKRTDGSFSSQLQQVMTDIK